MEEPTAAAMLTGGRSLVSSPPAFSSDGKKLLVCTGSTVSVFSVSTGMLVTELEGHAARVTSVVVVPMAGPAAKFSSFCWTSSLDGTIAYWDFSAPELIRKVEVRLPIFSMVIPHILNSEAEGGGKPPDPYAFISVEVATKPSDQKKPLEGQIKIYNLTTSMPVGGLLAETRKPEVIVVSKSGEYIGIKNKRKLHIWKVPVKHFRHTDIKKIKLHHTKSISALAFHPFERMVAGGDVTGRILIWRGFGKQKFSESTHQFNKIKHRDEEERPGVRGHDDAEVSSTWHWHSAEVKFLSFSSDGAYLYSGGREGVIVVWQLETGKKRFLPRIGSPLLYFAHSPDPSLSYVSCADNQIHLLKMPSMDISKSISGIKLPFSFPETYERLRGEFAFDHDAGLVALRTETFCVQFFSLFDDVEISQVQVCERNYQPVDDVMVVLALLALSVDGYNMGTVEIKLPEEGIGGLVCLKFWTRGPQAGRYSLSTVIYEPHSDADISALAFRPNHNMAVTSSYGGDFKIWVYKSGLRQKYQKFLKSGWRCQSVGSYRKRPMTAAAFSADGSVLAVAAESVVTLWDPDANILVAVIGETYMPIVKLAFTGNSEHLVTVSQGPRPQVAVWNMTRLSMSWCYRLLVEAVACAEDGSLFAILMLKPTSSNFTFQDQDGLILLFDAGSPEPMATWLVKKAKGGALGFLKSDPSLHDVKVTEGKASSEMLVFINSEHEYVIFDPFSNKVQQIRKGGRNTHASDEETGLYGYTALYGELPKFDPKSDQAPIIPFTPLDRPWETIFNGSSHALPPLTKLCGAFLASLLERRSSTTE